MMILAIDQRDFNVAGSAQMSHRIESCEARANNHNLLHGLIVAVLKRFVSWNRVQRRIDIH
jgi:hypothetical protein